MKKVIAVISAVILVLSIAAEQAFALTGGGAKLYNVYADDMIFEQNAPVVLSGTAPAGSTVSAELIGKNGQLLQKADAVTPQDGSFRLTLDGVDGGYDEYSLRLYNGNVLFDELNNIVFGEVWLASGQSNMQYPLAQDKDGIKLYEANAKLSPWLRVLLAGGITKYNGSDTVLPYEPQDNIEDVKWITGEDRDVYETSAVAYWFADKLRQELDVPVGILNASLGGSSIVSWLSRESVEESSLIKTELVASGQYYDEDSWYGREVSQAFDMTANYNLKIYPLRHFTCAGMIWYQGETDCMFDWDYGIYSQAVDCLQSDYSKLLAPEGETLPFIFTSLAACDYGKVRTAYDMNVEFGDIQTRNSDYRALTAIYDVSLDFFESVGAIHPSTKEPVGERMFHSAMGLVYGEDDTYTAALPLSTQVSGSDIYIKFKNTGRGLTSRGEKLSDFSVCAQDGIYLPAEAEITAPDTVKVSADGVSDPVSVTYAYSNSAGGANLYAESEDGFLMPAAAFITERVEDPQYTKFTSWMECEDENLLRIISPSDMIGVYPTWTSKNSEIEFTQDSAFSGSSGLHTVSTLPLFSVEPFFNYHRFRRDYICSDIRTDLSNYGSLSFMVRNNGETDSELRSVRFYVTDVLWYAPETQDGPLSYTIPADGEWHKVTYDLNSLRQWGKIGGASFGNEKLSEIRYLRLKFRQPVFGNADISLDDFRFTSDGKEIREAEYSVFKPLEKMLEVIGGLLIKIDKLIYT